MEQDRVGMRFRVKLERFRNTMKEIHCETLVPEPIIQIPKNGEILTFNIGYRLTNKSSTPYRFELQKFRPQFLDPNQKLIQIGINRNSFTSPKDEDIPLLQPNESIEYLMNISLGWFDTNIGGERVPTLGLGGEVFYGGCWGIEVYLGNYRIQFVYCNQKAENRIIFLLGGKSLIDQLWCGELTTPFVDFCLDNRHYNI